MWHVRHMQTCACSCEFGLCWQWTNFFCQLHSLPCLLVYISCPMVERGTTNTRIHVMDTCGNLNIRSSLTDQERTAIRSKGEPFRMRPKRIVLNSFIFGMDVNRNHWCGSWMFVYSFFFLNQTLTMSIHHETRSVRCSCAWPWKLA